MSPIRRKVGDLNRLNKPQIKLAAGVLARAFQDDPLWAYFFPDAFQRMNKLSHSFRMLVRYGILYGEVYATAINLAGVTVWLPSEKVEMSPWGMMRSGGFSMMLKMGTGEMARIMRYTEWARDMHQRHAPFRHWYLQFVGVDPEFQGKGYASTLLKPILSRMDTEQVSCYLETQNQENVPMYQHYGFRVIEEGTIPGTDIGHWAMLRG